MRREGASVFFAENTLLLNLFGLLFWDEIFESGQLHSGFDWLPDCLKDRSFIRLFAAQIEAKLSAVRTGSALPIAMRTVASKCGRPNGVEYVRAEALRALLSGS
jgi:DNA polymerase III subunit epsilon